MPGLAVIPEVDSTLYNAYARQVAKKRRSNSLPGQTRAVNTQKKYKSTVSVKTPRTTSAKPDYYGLDNSMRNLTLAKPRKWRTKNGKEPMFAWQKSTFEMKQTEKAEDEDDNASVMSLDGHILRRSRNSGFTKFKYPEKYHYGLLVQQAQVEENIPPCLRQFPRYCNQAVRQDSKYSPMRSVTHLNVHPVRSSHLPHPSADGAVVPRRRPTSAPPGSMTSYVKRCSSFNSSTSNVVNKSKTTPSVKSTEDLDRNGSYQFVYEEEIEDEGPSHATLAVEDSDEDKECEDLDQSQQINSDSDAQRPESRSPVTRKFGGNTNEHFSDSSNIRSEELEIKDETGVLSDTTTSLGSDTSETQTEGDSYSDTSKDDSDSIEYEPDFS